jgi:hypothetical protein
MLEFTRRKFMCFTPPKRKVTEAMLIAGQKAANPPLIYGPNTFSGGVSYTDFEKIGDQLFSRGELE